MEFTVACGRNVTWMRRWHGDVETKEPCTRLCLVRSLSRTPTCAVEPETLFQSGPVLSLTYFCSLSFPWQSFLGALIRLISVTTWSLDVPRDRQESLRCYSWTYFFSQQYIHVLTICGLLVIYIAFMYLIIDVTITKWLSNRHHWSQCTRTSLFPP